MKIRIRKRRKVRNLLLLRILLKMITMIKLRTCPLQELLFLAEDDAVLKDADVKSIVLDAEKYN